RGESLDEVVVGPAIQARDAIADGAAGGKHRDRGRTGRVGGAQALGSYQDIKVHLPGLERRRTVARFPIPPATHDREAAWGAPAHSEPHWPPSLAVLAALTLYLTLDSRLQMPFGWRSLWQTERWLMPILATALPLPPDADADLRPARLASPLRRLPVRLVHQCHRRQPDRHDAPDAVGETADAGAVADLRADDRHGGSPRRQYPELNHDAFVALCASCYPRHNPLVRSGGSATSVCRCDVRSLARARASIWRTLSRVRRRWLAISSSVCT